MNIGLLDQPAGLRPDAAAQSLAETRKCLVCPVEFHPVVPWQRFHSDECRRGFHRRKAAQVDQRIGTGLRGKISKVSILRRGTVSVVMHFGMEEGDQARQLTPGQVLEIL